MDGCVFAVDGRETLLGLCPVGVTRSGTVEEKRGEFNRALEGEPQDASAHPLGCGWPAPRLDWGSRQRPSKISSKACARSERGVTNGMDPHPTHEQDLDLARRVLDRDQAALQALLDRLQCVPRILAARNRMLGRPLSNDELADLAQDVVASALRKLDTFEGRAALETWLYRIASWELMNRIRRRQRRRGVVKEADALEDFEPASSGPGPAELAEEADAARLRQRLHAELERLSPADQELVRLKHYEDLSFTQLGERLGSSPNTLKARYYRAMSKLRTLLAPLREEVS